MYRLAIFDFDGTLADSFPCFLEALNAAAARYGFRGIDARDLDALRGLGSWQLMERLEIPLWQVPMITAFVRRRMGEQASDVKLFPGVHEAMEDLVANGVTLAIVTSNSEASVRGILGDRLASLVKDYRCDVSIFGKRPRLRQALAATRTAADDAIVIGDELRDLKAARAEGIAFGGVCWGFTLPGALRAAEPELMFERVDDIVPALAMRASRPLPA